ncbi:MAG TPA: alpha-1,2-fucosyltransferase [Puia sp.]|nr:alpha-1,2-fucosyltransferase [Puia sp.]
MLIVKIHYGLGNQLFQYAFARSLSLRKNTNFRLDISFFETDTFDRHPRVYQLNQFNIQEKIASGEEIKEFLNPSMLKRRWRSVANRFLRYYKRKVVNESRADFDENIFRVKDGAYLFGFWQDIRYFSAIEDVLKKELVFKNMPTGLNKEILGQIETTHSISLHIRRGDYLTDSHAVNNLGVCDLSYYQRAVERMSQRVSDPVFYIFSDDPEWVRGNFHIPFQTVFVSNNSEENAFEDLRLMSNCRHHIIANSSFSCWGALLSANKDKIVIAPRVWRSNGPDMFLPSGWMAL